jgi:CheY-like chemotaxis protein
MDSQACILVGDDEEAIRSALSTFQGQPGYAAFTAATGTAALGLVEQQVPDPVLLDVVLDERDQSQMSGLEVCRRLWQRSRFIPIIMLTSYPEWQGWLID